MLEGDGESEISTLAIALGYSAVRLDGAPVPLGSNAFLGAAAARLCSASRCLSSPLQVLARFHYRRAAVHSSPRDTGNLSGDRWPRRRSSHSPRATGLLLRRTANTSPRGLRRRAGLAAIVRLDAPFRRTGELECRADSPHSFAADFCDFSCTPGLTPFLPATRDPSRIPRSCDPKP